MNRLSKETSPYLLQHADNPVDWHPWCEAAFAKAEEENKPILISIGYSTCHWCHVMERESFEDIEIARIMNDNFVNIKVDREERPDIDAIYMEAVQILTGSGGWPLHCFLLPDKRPFFGGTYFPPEERHGRPSWRQVLENISAAYHNQEAEVLHQAEQLTSALQDSDYRLLSNITSSEKVINKKFIHHIYSIIRERFDKEAGGLGTAPKFPSSMTLKFCLDYHYFTSNSEALVHVECSLQNMIHGGIYDQIGGGFSRYSTDRFWLIPHFEKMLYDNALLINVLADTYQLTKNSLYKQTIEETLTYVKTVLWSAEGGFFTAQDADSEGVEGKYYVWNKDEIDTILGQDADLFCQYYGVTKAGNWESNNILNRQATYEAFAQSNSLELDDFTSKMKTCRGKLFNARLRRVAPNIDDKILLSWNALMTTAFVKAYKALNKQTYLNTAIENMAFLLETFEGENYFFHAYKDNQRQHQALLDDYAFLIEALLQLFEVTQELRYLTKADALTTFVINNFYDNETRLFFYTSSNQEQLIARTKELYDNALPSGNSTMAHNLQQLGILLGKTAYKTMAYEMLQQMSVSIEKYPTAFANWAAAMQNYVHPTLEIAVVGKQALMKTRAIFQKFIPNKVIMAAIAEDEDYPLLKGKFVEDEALIFVCQDYTCQLPVRSIDEYFANRLK